MGRWILAGIALLLAAVAAWLLVGEPPGQAWRDAPPVAAAPDRATAPGVPAADREPGRSPAAPPHADIDRDSRRKLEKLLEEEGLP